MNLFTIYGEGAEAKMIHNVSTLELREYTPHPNRREFRGVLASVDTPSDKPPAGSRGHRVILTRRAAEAAIPSLLGMGIGYASTFDRHDVRRKVGVITQAEVVDKMVEFSGFLYEKDFPQIVHELRDGRDSELGVSYEVSDALIRDITAKVWVMDRVTFTGAAIIRKNKAAYSKTWIELV